MDTYYFSNCECPPENIYNYTNESPPHHFSRPLPPPQSYSYVSFGNSLFPIPYSRTYLLKFAFGFQGKILTLSSEQYYHSPF